MALKSNSISTSVSACPLGNAPISFAVAIARDTIAFLGTETPDRKFQYSEYTAVGDIAREDPFVCAIWENVQRYDGQLVFSNPKRLGLFLTLRALMFRGLYYNPYSRFFEYLIGKGFVKYLYQKGEITRQQLLEEQDPWIENKISEVIWLPIFYGPISRPVKLSHRRV